MDTLSRDSNSSGSVLPLVGVIAGALALVLSATALFKLSTLQKTVVGHEDAISKIPTLETSINAASAKSESDLKGLRSGVQSALDTVGNEIGAVKARLDKLEEAAKKPAPAAGGKGGKGGGGVVTGTVDANGNYTVAPGDTLSKIAKKFATRVDAIEAENPGIDASHLKVGQKVKIPKK